MTARADDLARIEELEDVERAWYAAHSGMPGMTVHSSDEITWMRGPGVTWSNAAIRVRLPSARIDQELRSIFAQTFANGRGFGLWISELAEPADLARRLTAFGFRSRKRFPAMRADLAALTPTAVPKGIEVGLLDDEAMFPRYPHPYLGPITTPIRRFEMNRLAHLRRAHPKRVFETIATRSGVPVGSATVLVDRRVAVFHDVGVIETERGKGIGAALMSAACTLARSRGARSAVLLASGMGFGVYERVGFREVGRIAYWYAAKAPVASSGPRARSSPHGM